MHFSFSFSIPFTDLQILLQNCGTCTRNALFCIHSASFRLLFRWWIKTFNIFISKNRLLCYSLTFKSCNTATLHRSFSILHWKSIVFRIILHLSTRYFVYLITFSRWWLSTFYIKIDIEKLLLPAFILLQFVYNCDLFHSNCLIQFHISNFFLFCSSFPFSFRSFEKQPFPINPYQRFHSFKFQIPYLNSTVHLNWILFSV